MLKLNGNIVEIYKFPDGTPRMPLDVENLEKHEKNGTLCFEIEWLYEKNEELQEIADQNKRVWKTE